jgi:hypothetical protein
MMMNEIKEDLTMERHYVYAMKDSATVLPTLTYKCLVFFCFKSVLICSPGWPEIYYIAQAGLELMIFLPQHPEFWDYKHA